MALHHEAAAVLDEPAVRRINFQLGGLPVTAHELSRVAALLRADRIHVYVHKQMSHAAEYVPRRDAILLKDTSLFTSTYGKSAIVHESVHAMTDMNEAKSTTLYTAEVAAYLAQMIYADAAGDEKFRFKALIMNPAGRIARETLRLVDKFDMKNNVVNLNWAQYENLRKAIQAHWRYRDWDDKQLFPADGVPRAWRPAS